MTPVRYDLKRAQVVCGDRRIGAATQTALLLFTLAAARGRWVRPSDMYGVLWPNPDYEPDCAKSQIFVNLYRLRNFIDGSNLVVDNWPRVAYRLIHVDSAREMPKRCQRETPSVFTPYLSVC